MKINTTHQMSVLIINDDIELEEYNKWSAKEVYNAEIVIHRGVVIKNRYGLKKSDYK